jgi:allantoinase
VVCPDGVRAAAFGIRGGRIETVKRWGEIDTGVELLDFGDRVILPGLVDVHVHVDEPGRTEWEGFEFATRGAAAGGYATLIDMPLNCLPATTTVESLHLKEDAAREACFVDYAFWGGVVPGNAGDIPGLVREGVLGFKCFLVHPAIEGFEMVTVPDLERAMPLVAESGLPLLVHSELPQPLDRARTALDRDPSTDWRKFATYLASRPSEVEDRAIQQMIALSRKFGCRVHIVHLASADAVGDLRAARREGVRVTVETCPHYLVFCAEDVPDGATLFKCAPPIRSRENRERLWAALLNGDIDLIATDHSPCPPALKQLERGSFLDAWGGISSLQFALPAVWTEARSRGVGLAEIARWMAERPAALAGLSGRKGSITAGCDADWVVFDPEASFRVEPAAMFHRHRMTAYAGRALFGVVDATFVRGVKVYEQGRFIRAPRGRRCVPQPSATLA